MLNENGVVYQNKDVMQLVIMPLTYRDKSRKQEAVSDAAQLAASISDDHIRTMALAGILTFADKIITDTDAEIIRRRLMMTKIEAIYEREKQEALKENTEKVTKEVTQQVTRQVTYSLIFDMVNTGELNREDAMKRVGLSDDEFTRELTKYRSEHSAESLTV